MSIEYGQDPLGKTRFYGIYRGVVVDIKDPLKKYRIKVKVPQVLGTEVSGWATACMPISSNDNHPNHKHHLPTQTVSQIQNHDGVFSCSSGGSVHVVFQHQPTQVELNHDHVSTDETVYDQKEYPHREHTLHRRVPKVDQNVWVMFEAGDPEFPVWMGIFPSDASLPGRGEYTHS